MTVVAVKAMPTLVPWCEPASRRGERCDGWTCLASTIPCSARRWFGRLTAWRVDDRRVLGGSGGFGRAAAALYRAASVRGVWCCLTIHRAVSSHHRWIGAVCRRAVAAAPGVARSTTACDASWTTTTTMIVMTLLRRRGRDRNHGPGSQHWLVSDLLPARRAVLAESCCCARDHRSVPVLVVSSASLETRSALPPLARASSKHIFQPNHHRSR